jgi:hypothetical protein
VIRFGNPEKVYLSLLRYENESDQQALVAQFEESSNCVNIAIVIYLTKPAAHSGLRSF